MTKPRNYALGWQRDLPDHRDFAPVSPEIEPLLEKVATVPRGFSVTASEAPQLEASVDLRKWCSPIEDQENIGSCTAQAGVGLLEYYQRRACRDHINGSRLFLYKATRNLMGVTGDTGAYLRTTMKAMVLFGVAPEHYWPYDIARFDDEPSPFLYAYGQSYQSLKYYRLDTAGLPPKAVLDRVRQFLAAQLPSMFGFTVYNYGNRAGEIGFPEPGESAIGGHAVIAVGYDDNRMINGDKGALRIRNSWGTDWGEDGYGWLPYKYVLKGLAVDFWSLFRAEYVDEGAFGPNRNDARAMSA